MNLLELTRSVSPATSRAMRLIEVNADRSGWRAVRAAMMLVGGAMGLSACISVTAPDKPIVIELNINIKQEVVYRLSAEAANTIEENPEIF